MDNVDWSGSNVYVSCLVVFFNDRLTRYTGTRNGKSNARRVLRISPIRRALSLRDATSLRPLPVPTGYVSGTLGLVVNCPWFLAPAGGMGTFISRFQIEG